MGRYDHLSTLGLQYLPLTPKIDGRAVVSLEASEGYITISGKLVSVTL